MYVWCKLEPEVMVSVWGYPVRAGMLPWVYVGLSVVTGGDPFMDLIGIVSGHLYVYLKLVLPITKGYNLLKTPKLIIDLVDRLERWAS